MIVVYIVKLLFVVLKLKNVTKVSAYYRTYRQNGGEDHTGLHDQNTIFSKRSSKQSADLQRNNHWNRRRSIAILTDVTIY